MEDLEHLEQVEQEREVPWWEDFIDITAYGMAAAVAVYLLTVTVLSLAHPY
jgi:hypothetical protein